MRRNRDLNIQCAITLLDSFLGKQLEANYQLPSGRTQTVSINVPAGITNGDTIRYQGLGDDSAQGAPRGNLNVTVIVHADPNFERKQDDLYTAVDINPIEAMIGCKKFVKNITGEQMEVDIRAGVESGVEFASNGNGFTNVNTGRKGRFVTVVKIKTPKITNQEILASLKELNAKISKTS